MLQFKSDFTPNEALKVDQLCDRVLDDIGSIHARITTEQDNGRSAPMSPELVSLRRHLRDLQDNVRETFPTVFFK